MIISVDHLSKYELFDRDNLLPIYPLRYPLLISATRKYAVEVVNMIIAQRADIRHG